MLIKAAKAAASTPTHRSPTPRSTPFKAEEGRPGAEPARVNATASPIKRWREERHGLGCYQFEEEENAR